MPSRSASSGISSGWRESKSSSAGLAPPRSRGAARPSPRRGAPSPARRRARRAPSAIARDRRRRARPTLAGELLQDADDLAPLLVLQLDDVVVELDRGQRLDEEARPRARAAVDDARQLAPVLGLQQQHVAVVARRDDAVLQQPLARRGCAGSPPSRDVSCDFRRSERAPQLGEPRRGVVGHLARRQERAADGDRHVARVLDARRRRRASAGRPPRGRRGARSRRRPR